MAFDEENPLLTADCTASNPDVYMHFLDRFKETALLGPVADWETNEIEAVGHSATALTAAELYSMVASNIELISPATFALLDYSVLTALKSLVDASGGDHLDVMTDSQLRQRTQSEVEDLGLVYPVLDTGSLYDVDPVTGAAVKMTMTHPVLLGSILVLVCRVYLNMI